jgi:hypothetical protein
MADVASPSRPRRAAAGKSVSANANSEGWTWAPLGEKGIKVYNRNGKEVKSAGENKAARSRFVIRVKANAAFANSHARMAGQTVPVSQPRGARGGGKKSALAPAVSGESAGSVGSVNNGNGNNGGAAGNAAAKGSWSWWSVPAELGRRAVGGLAKLKKDPSRPWYVPGFGWMAARMRGLATGLRPMFSMAQLQSWSGSELETAAIEFGVKQAGIKRVKFDRGNMGAPGARQLFETRERTFFFKPRLSLDPIKKDVQPWTKVMADVVSATAEKGKGKGTDHVETDVIEVFPPGSRVKGETWPSGLIRLYECKIGLGKPEGRGKAGESLQLMKAKRLLLKHWKTLYGESRAPPTIHCYFIAWKFGEITQNIPTVNIVPTSKVNKNVNLKNPVIQFTHHRVPFPHISKALRAAAGESQTNQNSDSTDNLKHWDAVKTLVPREFSDLTGLSAGFINGYLIQSRAKVLAHFSMLIETLRKNGIIYGNMNEATRRALGVRHNFVSGNGAGRPPPQDPQDAFELRLKGRLANYMRRWDPSFYNHIQNNRLKAQLISNSKSYLAAKALRAVLRLEQQNAINFTTGMNTKLTGNLPANSASELKRATANSNPKRPFINKHDRDEYINRVRAAIERANEILPASSKHIFKGATFELVDQGIRRNNQGGSSRRRAVPQVSANEAVLVAEGRPRELVLMAFKNAENFEEAYINFLKVHGPSENLNAIFERIKNKPNTAEKIVIKSNLNGTYRAASLVRPRR